MCIRDSIIAVASLDDVARRVRIEHIDRIAGDRIDHHHILGIGHHLDAEVVGHLRGKGAGGAIGRQAKLDRHVEFALEARAVGRRAGRGQVVDQLQVEAEEALAGRRAERGGLAGRCLLYTSRCV